MPNQLSHFDDDSSRRQQAAMHISMANRRAADIMQYPHVLTEIRHQRTNGLTWKEVTSSTKELLIDHGVARPIDFMRNKYFNALTGVVGKAHNDRRRYRDEISSIKNMIRTDAALEAFIWDVVHENGNYGAPVRTQTFRDAMVVNGLRPAPLSGLDARSTQRTRKRRQIEIAHANRLARVAIGELHYAQGLQYSDDIWEDPKEWVQKPVPHPSEWEW